MIEAFEQVGPLYNLVLVVITIWLFVRLFRTQAYTEVFMTPWKLVFGAVCLFVLETALTIIRGVTGFYGLRYLNGFWELIIIALFINALLMQKEYLEKKSMVASPPQQSTIKT